VCEYSDIAVFSFHPVKIITTAEGGCATTNDENIFERMQLFRSHGVTRDPKFMTKETEGACGTTSKLPWVLTTA
jgi:dTDP-4-amino-4,6-dideoxygalactose transaminase